MSSSETGYAKNAANFKDLIIQLKNLEGDYQPPKPSLNIEALEAISIKSEELMRTLSQLAPIYNQCVDKQELIFSTQNNLVTRSYNYLKVVVDNPGDLETIKTIADKIRGVNKKTDPVEEGKTNHSQAQTSYDNKLENFKRYIDALQNTKVYLPLESDIKLETFNDLAVKMGEALTAVALSKSPVDVARKNRYNFFYADKTGLVDIANDIKTYSRAVLKKDHQLYKAIQDIKFNKISH